MAWYNPFSWGNKDLLNEEIEKFKNKGEVMLSPEEIKKTSGEGFAELPNLGFGSYGIGSLNTFYSNFINKAFESEVLKIQEYRNMAMMPEIAAVIEDACNEAINTNEDNKSIQLKIIDENLLKNSNIVQILNDEFNKLFYDKLNINEILWDLFRSYLIDGRIYYERIINESKSQEGIIGLKKLPSETMDFDFDKMSGRILKFYQFLGKRPANIVSEAQIKNDKNVIVFEPAQIGFVDYGIYGKSKKEIFGYLEKSKTAYNQLKLLETSVIIYRLVRSPERFVFKLDVGNMPFDKAKKELERFKNSMNKKQTFDPTSGRLTNESNIFSILENFFIPVNQDGRGSSIETIGGNSKGFESLDDIYYFSRKLYRALKYPMSRVTAAQDKRESDNIFGGSGGFGEITRDEIAWAKFLEKHLNKFSFEMLDLFMVHLDFKGLKKQYGLKFSQLQVFLDPPNNYKAQMDQKLLETKFQNYNTLSSDQNFSSYFLMKNYLNLTDEEIEENYKGKVKDKELQNKYKIDDENQNEESFDDTSIY